MSNPYKIIEPTCVSFSGGRTSAYMLYKVLEAHDMSLPKDAVVCFANTGKEDEATLRFVENFSKEWNVHINWLEWNSVDAKPTFKVVDFETASRNGEPFEKCIHHYRKLPNPAQRWCTGQLKIRTIHRYLRSLGWEHDENDNNDFVGIRADEPRRAAKMSKNKLPLYLSGVTKETINQFWSEQSFTLDLQIHRGESLLGNCDLCFLKSVDKKVNIARLHPEKVLWWAKMESDVFEMSKESTGFNKGHPSYRELHNFSTNQMQMFDDESIDCFCGD